ncbi:DegT/DnrJ/EryC1/StrS family aminotransferase [candidate division KSB1 bacterium]|nr:DegT/DnrJ/EryC1/StrS family aminotransferase [candidate division KSB1 bacterium]
MKQKIPWAKPVFTGLEREFLVNALESTWVSGGPFLDRLERDLANYCKLEYALTVSNGTAALHMAYLALGIGSGDEVVVPGFAFLAAANIALLVGAKPVFAEVDPKTWCMNAAQIEKCITNRTKAIVPVHTYGNVCDMDDILDLAAQKNLPVIEDAAEAFASKYKGKPAGAMGDIGTFSFQATKTITTGEGGMVITNQKELYDKMALYRSHGMLRKTYYWHELPGHNFRLTNLQAALGCAQFENLENIIRERKRIHEKYINCLSRNSGISLQMFPLNVDPVLWAIAVKLDPRAYPQGRDRVIEQMKEEQIETRPGFYAPSFMKHIYECQKLPICEEISRQVISLPTYVSLQNEQIEFVCQKLLALKA